MERIVAFKFGRIGDLLALTPALRALRRAHPDAALELVTTRPGAAALATNPHLDRIHVLRVLRPPAAVNPEKALLLRRLRRPRPDLALLFETHPRYHALLRAVAAPRSYAFASPREEEGPDRIRPRRNRHFTENCLAVLRRAGVPDDGLHYDFPVPGGAHARARSLLARAGLGGDGLLIGVHPGHFRRWRRLRRSPAPKAWPPDRWARVLRSLARRAGARFVITGTRQEGRLAREILARAPEVRAATLAGETDLPTLAAVISRCALFLSVDSGPAHLAAAVGTPLVVLFGPVPPGAMGPLGDPDRVRHLHPEPVEPPPAGKGYHPRMWAIRPEDVLGAVRELGVGGG